MSLLRIYYLLNIFLNLAVAIFCADKYSREDFPPGFIFGSGTSAYQVEGAANEDGRTPSILDTSAHAGYMHWATGDVSVDEYHKYKEDVELMVETGLDAYRFSISWSRLIPNGRGPVNPKGLQYYNNFINELISHGIQPHVTLYHYDLPQVLEDEYEGWISRNIVKDFTAFAEVCFREFGDRVKYWTTFNEPNVLPLLSYDVGMLPPNRCSPPFGINCSKGNSTSEPYLVGHNLLLAHSSAVRLYREKYQGKQFGFIGINLFMFGTVPLTNSTKDILATQRTNDFMVGLIANPVVFGDYPEIVKKTVGDRLPDFTNQESKQIKGSFDFLGLNHYVTVQIKDNSTSRKSELTDFTADMAAEMIFEANNSMFPAAADARNSTVEFPINPKGMQIALEYLKQVYGNPPIYIHENGQRTVRNSSLEDASRVKHMHAYIGSVLDSIRNGSNVRGYFTWSLMDVFEILGGYEVCYGLYYVDLNDPQLKRQPKLSARWYSQFLKGQTVCEDGIIELPQHFSALSATDSVD